MDTLGSLAFATTQPHAGLLERKPYTPDSSLISKIMFRNIIGQAFFQLLVLLPFVVAGEKFFPEYFMTNTYHPLTGERIYDGEMLGTFVFNTFVFLQLFNEINSRKCNIEMNAFAGMFQNWWFPGLWILAAGLQAVIVEFLGIFMDTIPMPWDLWLFSMALGFTQVISGFLLKLVRIDPHEGEIALNDNIVFEGAEWLANGAKKAAQAKKEKESKKGKKGAYDQVDDADGEAPEQDNSTIPASRHVYIGNAFYQPVEEVEMQQM